jgi:CheY-like chemotaxis protein
LTSIPNDVTDEQSTSEPVKGTSDGLRILIVDDNKDAADSLSMLLRFLGHDVSTAYEGASAMKIAESFHPAAIFLDIGMPITDGYEVARQMRRLPGLENVFLIALTGWGQQDVRRRTSEAGFNHHLVKPLEPKLLKSLLQSLTQIRSDATK